MNIGLLGYGYWGRIAARAIARVGKLHVIVDPNPNVLAEARDTWGPWGTRVASEPRVAFEECSAVWVATPTVSHFDDVHAALCEGVHVMCEKPFVQTSEQARQLAVLAESQRVALMVGHLQLYTAAHAQAKGKLRHATAEDTVRVWMTRRNDRASLSDGSVLWGIGPHDVAAAVDLFGPGAEVAWCAGTEHRVCAQLAWKHERRWVDLELDWLAEHRLRTYSMAITPQGGTAARVRGEFAGAVETMEPLLKEAYQFRYACEEDSLRRGELRDEAVEVTRVLEEMDWARLGLKSKEGRA